MSDLKTTESPSKEEARSHPLVKLTKALRVQPCGGGKFGIYLHGSRSSYIGLASPMSESAAYDWRARIVGEMAGVLFND